MSREDDKGWMDETETGTCGTCGWMDGSRIHGSMARSMDGRTDGRMDGYAELHFPASFPPFLVQRRHIVEGGQRAQSNCYSNGNPN